MRRQLLAIGLTVLAAAGCTADATGPGSPNLATLRNAPTALTFGDTTIALSAYLWRDFMPVSPPNGKPLSGHFVLKTDDPEIWPGVTFEQVWVLNGIEVWEPRLYYHPLLDPAPGTIVMVGDGGPKWPPGITVDVVARVRRENGTLHLVRAAHVVIQRTD